MSNQPRDILCAVLLWCDGEQKQFDTIYFDNKTTSAADCEITEMAWLVRAALARTLIRKQEPETPAPGGGGPLASGSGKAPQSGGGGSTGEGTDEEQWSSKNPKSSSKRDSGGLTKYESRSKTCLGRIGTT
jgi:hypothetical protein